MADLRPTIRINKSYLISSSRCTVSLHSPSFPPVIATSSIKTPLDRAHTQRIWQSSTLTLLLKAPLNIFFPFSLMKTCRWDSSTTASACSRTPGDRGRRSPMRCRWKSVCRGVCSRGVTLERLEIPDWCLRSPSSDQIGIYGNRDKQWKFIVSVLLYLKRLWYTWSLVVIFLRCPWPQFIIGAVHG